MYRLPSARRRKNHITPLNLVPILDAVFILIFFLLTSAQFVKIYELNSDLPILTEQPPQESEGSEPLNLVVRLDQNSLRVFTGSQEKLMREFKVENGDGFLKEFNQLLIGVKQKYNSENSVVFEPDRTINYQKIVKVLDQIKTYINDQGESVPLFEQVVFGNIEM